MAIQMRRGQSADFVPDKLVPGEWAVSQDDNKIYMCVRSGKVVELGSSATFESLVQEAEAWAVGTKDNVPVSSTDKQYNNNSKYYSEQSANSAIDASTSATNASTSETNAKTSETNANTSETAAETYKNSAETAWNNIDNAMQKITPTMSVDFTTGILSYTGSFFDFTINNSGHLEWGIAV